MADTRKPSVAADGQRALEREVPVPRCSDVTVEQAAKRLRRLSPDKLRRLRANELVHQKREAVLVAIDRLLEGQVP
jgi:hypothetical protein